MIYTTNKITLIILLKTNGCKRLKMTNLKSIEQEDIRI